MAYTERIKNFDRIRDYMREFYVYGIRSRDEFTKKSARSYDDERRRVESWLGDYMRFRQTPDGKYVYLSIDSRVTRHNPLYAAWKTKSFTDGDITLHFILFDILSDPEVSKTLSELTDEVDAYLASFDEPRTFDRSTIRKKLREYEKEGLVVSERRGRETAWRRTPDTPLPAADVLDFFSEAAPCGVIGSYLLDKTGGEEDVFAFKHHYITSAMDAEILCTLFEAMREKRRVTVRLTGRHSKKESSRTVVPLRVFISAQSGRQYLMAHEPEHRRIRSFRIDSLTSVVPEDVCEDFDGLRRTLDSMESRIWGISTSGDSGSHIDHIEFTVKYARHEPYIRRRLEREKRCGTLEEIRPGYVRFSADVYDAGELIPWIRTFLCRITDFSCSDKALEEQFRSDLHAMYALYGLEGGEKP